MGVRARDARGAEAPLVGGVVGVQGEVVVAGDFDGAYGLVPVGEGGGEGGC